MRRHLFLSCLSLGILTITFGCIMGQSEAETKKDASAPSAVPAAVAAPAKAAPKEAKRVREDWQQKMLSLMENQGAGYTDGWGLFSEGGWSDNGQVIVLATTDRSLVKVFSAGPGKKTFDGEHSLTKDDFAKVESVTEDSAKLPDIDLEMFDGLIYEFVHAVRRKDGKAEVVDRLYIKNNGSQPMVEQQKLIDVFQEFRKK